MKKLLFAVLLGLILNMSQSYAQNNFEESEFYYITKPIERIWLYRSGYIVAYQRGFNLVRTYVPIDWFTPAGAADLIVLRSARAWPHITIYYQNGEFSHVRLYVRERSHPTWSVVPFHVDLSEYFRGIEEVVLEF
jgi:hypothetical protein